MTSVISGSSSLWALAGPAQSQVTWTSADGGVSWRPGGELPDIEEGSLIPLSATTAVADTISSVVETTDGGSSWHAIGSPDPCIPPGHTTEDAEADIDPILAAFDPSTFWLFCGSEPGTGQEPKQVWYSDDGAQHWTLESNNEQFQNQPLVGNFPTSGYHFDGSYLPVNRTTVLAELGRFGFLISTDEGHTWTDPLPGDDDQDDGDLLSLARSGDGGYIADTGSSRWTSRDGIHWTKTA